MNTATTTPPTSTYLSAYFAKLGNETSAQAFDMHARRYAHNYCPLMTGIPKDAPVLDAGCGVGQFLYFLNQQGFTNIDGIDYDGDMVPVAQQMVPQARCAHAGVADFLADKPQHYALITMNDVIEHLRHEDVIPTLIAIRKALRPDGVAIIKTPNMACPLGPNVRYKDFTHRLGFTESSLEQALLDAGFTAGTAHEEEGPVTSWRAALRKRICLRGALRLWRMLYFCLEALPAPKVLTQWVIVRATVANFQDDKA